MCAGWMFWTKFWSIKVSATFFTKMNLRYLECLWNLLHHLPELLVKLWLVYMSSTSCQLALHGCVCVCVWVWVWDRDRKTERMWTFTRNSVSEDNHRRLSLPLTFFEAGFLDIHHCIQTCWPLSFQGFFLPLPPVSCMYSYWDYKNRHHEPNFYMGSYNSNSSLHAFTRSTFTHWAVCPAPSSLFISQ